MAKVTLLLLLLTKIERFVGRENSARHVTLNADGELVAVNRPWRVLEFRGKPVHFASSRFDLNADGQLVNENGKVMTSKGAPILVSLPDLAPKVSEQNFEKNTAKYAAFRDEDFGVDYSRTEALILCSGWSTSFVEPNKPKPDFYKMEADDLHDPVKEAHLAYYYFLKKGAKVRGIVHVEDDGADSFLALKKIKKFLTSPSSNAKVLYFTGHGRPSDGGISLGGNKYFTPEMFLRVMRHGEFTGLITLIVDSCYAGKWFEEIWKQGWEYLETAPKKKQRPLLINLRLASLGSETARDGQWSSRLFHNLETQVPDGEDVTKESAGWGTMIWLRKIPNEEDVVFTAKKFEPQRDIAVNITYNPVENSWTKYQPDDRKEYLSHGWSEADGWSEEQWVDGWTWADGWSGEQWAERNLVWEQWAESYLIQ